MSIKTITGLILRFRDLVTARGVTIKEHQKIIKDNEYVWWGWWNKLGETIADDAFRELSNKIEKGKSLNLILFDSGQEIIYKAVCTDIVWDTSHKEIDSPEPKKTPKYYSGQRSCLIWFKFSRITKITDRNTLNKLTYVKVDSFFEHGKSDYSAFYGKQLHSISELRQQDRTIWFVRDFKSGDRTHEIKLLNSNSVTPTNFSQNFFETPTRTLLWLSDLHFSEDGHHAFPYETTATQSELGDKLRADFNQIYEFIAGIIISGDISWKSSPKEFEFAKEFIKKLNSWTSLKSEQIAVCPGNHDLKFSENPAEKNSPVTVIDKSSRSAYSEFYQDLFFLEPNQFLSCGKKFLLGNAVPVEILCLNSSFLQQYPAAFQGHGFIGQSQLDNAANEMNWKIDQNNDSIPRGFRIVVLHHHLIPVTYSLTPQFNYPYSVVLDSEAVVRWLVKNRVNLVLHGHMHQPFCAKLKRPTDVLKPDENWHELTILGLGSSGVKGELGEINKNTVGFLTFNTDNVEISVHSIHPTNPKEDIWKIKVPYKTETK